MVIEEYTMLQRSGFVRDNINKFATFYRITDLIFIKSSLALALLIFQIGYSQEFFILFLISIVGFSIFAEMFTLYRSWRDGSYKEAFFNTLLSWSLSFAFVLFYAFLSENSIEISREVTSAWFAITAIALVSWRALFALFLSYIRRKGMNTRSAAIIALTNEGLVLAQEILDNPQIGYHLAGIYDDREEKRWPKIYDGVDKGNIMEGIENARLNQFDVVYIALPLKAEERIIDLLNLLGNTTANVQLVPNLFMFSVMGSSMSQIGKVQTISLYSNPLRGTHALIKRLEDIIISSIILIIISIPLIVIALAVKTTSKGPIIFKQSRYGLNGKEIKVWKFRSMTVTEDSDNVTQATKNDSRFTKIGAFLRRTSLDELPQFFNVLQGKMSVVGPRPHALAHNEKYRTVIDYYMLRHKIRPGITGWAQINGWRGETDTLEKMEMRIKYDLDYIRQWSLWMDVKIVFYTILRSFTDKNAY